MPSLLSGMNLLVIIFPIQCDSKGSSKTGTRQSHGGSGNPQPTQVWYSMAMRKLISCPVLLQHSARLLVLHSHVQKLHPLHKKLALLRSATYPGTVACKRPFPSSFRYVCLERRDKKAVPDVSFQVGKLLQLQRDQSSFSYCNSRDKTSCRTSQVRCWINTARSAISTILVISDCATSDTHPLVQDISLKKLTFKVTLLRALLTGQWTQTIHCFNFMDMPDKKCIFYLTSLQKQYRPGKHQKPTELEAFWPGA